MELEREIEATIYDFKLNGMTAKRTAKRIMALIAEQDKTSGSKSFCNDGLYDISVKVEMKIHWLTPVQTLAEDIERGNKQNLLDERAYKFAEETRRKLKEYGI